MTTPLEPIAPVTSATPVEPAPAAPVVVATRKTSGARWLNLLLGAAAVIAIGGVAFAIGRTTAPTPTFAGAFTDGGVIARPNGSFDPGAPGGGPNAPGFLGAAGGLSLEGTVKAVDADSITVTLDSGQEMTFSLDDTTTWHEATETDPSTVAVGDQVAVQVSGGRIDIDGGSNGNASSSSLTAGDITIRR